MAAIICVTLIDSSGNAQTGKDVDLYAGDGTGAKTGDFTDNGDGTYYYSLSTSGKYTVKVGGVTQTEMQNKYFAVDDQLKTGDVDNTTIEVSGGNLQVKDGGIDAAALATDAVETAKIKALNVTAAKLAADAVETAKIKDANVTAAKLAATVLGNRSYSYNHIISDSDPLDTSLDELDQAIGNLDFSDDPIVGKYYQMALNHTQFKNLTQALKVVSKQAFDNLRAITNGTSIFNNRIVWSDFQVAAAAVTSQAAALTEYAENTGALKTKIRTVLQIKATDKYVVLRCWAKVSGGATGEIYLYTSEIDQEQYLTESSYTYKEYYMDISSVTAGFYELEVATMISSGAGTVTIKGVQISIEGSE